MFSKREMFVAILMSLGVGFAAGYSKARERALAAIITATNSKNDDSITEEG